MKKISKNTRRLIPIILVFILHQLSLSAVGQQAEYSYSISQFVRNIPKSEYKGANQNWSLTQDNEGTIYVANRLGILEFNGISWKQYALNNSSQVRSVLATNDGRIYYGQFEDFGYFERDDFGQLQQVSLSDSLVIPERITNQEIWSIKHIGQKTYFKSFGKVFVYSNEKVETISLNTTVYSLFEYNNKPCVYLFSDGLFFIDENEQLQKAPFPKALETNRIINILKLNKGIEVVITEFNGIFIKNENNYIPWESEGNQLLKNYQLNKCVIINDELIAVGTIGNGIIILNSDGKIVGSYDKTSGLQNNTVLSFLTDKNNNLWAGLNGGIDFIEVNSSNLYCFDKSGKLGAVHCSIRYNKKLYLGTNQGLFCTSWENGSIENKITFEQIEEAKGQVWGLKVIDNKLLCNYNLGLLQIDNEKIVKIGNIGGYTIIAHPKRQDIIYQGNYTGIAVFKKNAEENWIQHQQLYSSSGGAKFLNIDPYENLWVGENIKNAKLLRLSNEGDSILSSRNLIEENGFNPKFNVRIFDYEDRIVLSNNGKYFTYDYISESVKPYEWLNKEIGPFMTSEFLTKTDLNEYWLLNRKQYGMFKYDGKNLNFTKEISHDNFNYSIESDRQNICKIDDDKYILGLDNGFMVWTTSYDTGEVKNWQPQIKLINATCNNEKGQITPLEIRDIKLFEIPFSYRNLNFTYAIPGNFPKSYYLIYRLDNDEWIDNKTATSLLFNYLPWGSHKLIVRAVDESQNILSEISYNVKISPPWYLKNYAFLLYLLVAVGIVYFLIYYNRYRLQKQKLAYLKKLKSDNTRRIIRLKNQYLKTEVQNKSAELVNYTVLLGKKNEVLINIKELLDKSSFAEENVSKISKIYDFINRNLSDKNDWKMFSAHFDEAHSNFLKKLKKAHELLTPSDLQLCAFLKMNLSSKEIASLLNISLRSVEVKRYRLRKKLNLDHEENLVEYLLEK